ncbi:MAG: type IV pilin protein, partial [Bdellovibrionales bacterium]
MVVGIIGILAAVAIPAYQTYQDSAREKVAQGSINIIKKAFVSCRALNSFATCATATINSTLEQQTDAPIAFSDDAATPITKGCWSVAVDNAVADESGTKCV